MRRYAICYVYCALTELTRNVDLDYRLYALDADRTQLNFRESYHTRIRYFLFRSTNIIHPIIICECRRHNATVAAFMRTEISDTQVLREVDESSCSAVDAQVIKLKGMECLHARYRTSTPV